MRKAAPSPKTAPAEIAKHLSRITHQHFFRTFEDCLALAINAFLRDDAAYMAIMCRYGPRHANSVATVVPELTADNATGWLRNAPGIRGHDSCEDLRTIIVQHGRRPVSMRRTLLRRFSYNRGPYRRLMNSGRS